MASRDWTKLSTRELCAALTSYARDVESEGREYAPTCMREAARRLEAASGVPEQQWIAVAPETMPNHHQRVIVCNAREQWWSVCTWDNEKGLWIDIETDGQNDWLTWTPGETTHWREPMALPETTHTHADGGTSG